MREQVRGEMCDIFNFLNKANKKIILDNNKIIALEDICLKKYSSYSQLSHWFVM